LEDDELPDKVKARYCPIDIVDFYYWMIIILECSCYGKAPSHILANLERYPPVVVAISKMAKGRQEFTRITAALNMYSKDQGHLTWDPFYQNHTDLDDIECIISKTFSKLMLFSDCTIDDDKLRNRSPIWKQMNCPLQKVGKAFGPTMHICCDQGTGLIRSVALAKHKDSCVAMTKVLMTRATLSRDATKVNLQGHSINIDRGYKDRKSTEFITNANGYEFGTVKRSSNLPVKFGKVGYRGSEDQIDIQEKGSFAVWSWKRSIGNGKHEELIAFRSGTGKVTLLASTNPKFTATNFVAVPQSTSSYHVFVGDRPISSEQRAKLRITVDQGLLELCEQQGDPSWFIFRTFVITSSVANALLVAEREIYSVAQQALLERMGKRLTSRNESAEMAAYQQQPFEELMRMTKDELKEICREYGSKLGGNKGELAERIREGPRESRDAEDQLKEKLLKSMFLKPIKSESMSIGSSNESNVFESVKSIHLLDGDLKVVAGPFEFGIVVKEDKPWIGTSVDGYMKIRDGIGDDAEIIDVALEIKTMTKPNTVNKARTIAEDHGIFVRCVFNDDTFLATVPDIGHRAQVLHHAYAFGVSYVLYLVANETELIHAVLVKFDNASLRTWESILDKYQNLLQWAHTNGQFPDWINDVSLKRDGYDIDRHCAQVTFGLRKSLIGHVEKYKRPFYPIKNILPQMVAVWNKAKVDVDLKSRYWRTLQMAEACQNPVTVICIRSLAAAVINAHLAIRLLALQRKGSAHFEHKTFIECKKWMSNGFTIIETTMAIAKHWKMSGIDLAAASKRNMRRISTESTDTSRINSLSFTFPRDGSGLNKEQLDEVITVYGQGQRRAWKYSEPESQLSKIRISKTYDHAVVSSKKQARCVVCSKPTTKICSTCQTSLCTTIDRRCFEAFHRQNLRAHLAANGYAGRNRYAEV